MKTPNTMQPALYLDLELNCPDRFRPGDADPEIIEIGLVELDIGSLNIVRERDYLVRPHRDISRRSTKITGLTNEDFKGAKAFTDVIAGIGSEWPGRATSIAWGEDGATLTRACRQHRVRMPFRRSIDLSQIVRQALLFENQLSLRSALELLGLAFDGCAHMALADARNTARLHAEIMRRLRASGVGPVSGREVTTTSQPTWFGQLLANSLNAHRDRGGSRSFTHQLKGVFMTGEDEPIVWSSRLDGKYNVKVIWIAPNRGELSIADDTKELHRETVSVSSKSEFGLGVGEIAEWQETAIAFVDKLEQS